MVGSVLTTALLCFILSLSLFFLRYIFLALEIRKYQVLNDSNSIHTLTKSKMGASSASALSLPQGDLSPLTQPTSNFQPHNVIEILIYTHNVLQGAVLSCILIAGAVVWEVTADVLQFAVAGVFGAIWVLFLLIFSAKRDGMDISDIGESKKPSHSTAPCRRNRSRCIRSLADG